MNPLGLDKELTDELVAKAVEAQKHLPILNFSVKIHNGSYQFSTHLSWDRSSGKEQGLANQFYRIRHAYGAE